MNASWQLKHLEDSFGKQQEFESYEDAYAAVSFCKSKKELNTLRLAAAKWKLVGEWQMMDRSLKCR